MRAFTTLSVVKGGFCTFRKHRHAREKAPASSRSGGLSEGRTSYEWERPRMVAIATVSSAMTWVSTPIPISHAQPRYATAG